MFSRILIANRGEIAVRVIRACDELGIETVAVYSTADQEALHVKMADRAICIGDAAPRESYLNAQAILTAASITECDAIHPGFGFLAENADFAHMTVQCGFTFIGPSAGVIRCLGDKIEARRQATLAEVPVIPGTAGLVSSLAEALLQAEEIGYPVLIKAAAGGGGRGLRLAADREGLAQAFQTAQSEAKAFFSDDRVYMERLLIKPRHIEVQLVGDRYGQVIHLGERDCSLQRRNQKLLEEAPSPFVDENLRRALGLAAVRLARQVGYEGVGTVEFLVDTDRQFYFMEMNTRIQVEHPVTEETTGLDLVQLQIEVAAGQPLALSQDAVESRGHAIECRIIAENPLRDFRPQPGRVSFVHFPGGKGVRVDSAIYSGLEIPPDYDSLLAKIITHAPNREQAVRRMRRALTECQISGLATNIDFLLAVLDEDDFLQGELDIGWLTRNGERLIAALRASETES